MEAAKRNQFGIRLIATSLVLGIAGDLILSNEAWGVSLPLFAGFLIAQVLWISRRSERKVTAASRWLLGAAFVFSLSFAWRDAAELKLLNGLAAFTLVGLAAVQVNGRPLRLVSIGDVVLRALSMWFVFVGDFCSLLFKDIAWAQALKERGMAGTTAVGRGVLLAIPLVITFGALLASADASFSSFLSTFTHVDGESVMTHGFVILLCAMLSGGLLRRIFVWQPAPPAVAAYRPFVLSPGHHPPYRDPNGLGLGATEFAIALGSLNALFAVFVAIQVPYLFGGSRHVLETAGLSYAEYARRGFFELVAVIGLAIPVLLGSHALIRKDSVVAERLWRVLSLVMVSLLGVVMLSAVDRMRLYVNLYDLTTLRVYVVAALVWMGTALLWFLVTTVRGKSAYFASGAFASMLAGVLILNGLSPDVVVARHNLAQMRAGQSIDARYLLTLSADAIPELIRSSDRFDSDLKADFARVALGFSEVGSWRSWNLSRQAARDAIRDRRSELTELGYPAGDRVAVRDGGP